MKSMPKQGSFLCHPERQRRIFAPSKVKRFFVTAFLRMAKGESKYEIDAETGFLSMSS